MTVGENNTFSNQEIILHERLPPFIAAFRVATELRQKINDGTDCFYAFQMPDDPDQMIATLKKKLNHDTEREDMILKEERIPIMTKGVHLYENSPLTLP